MNYTKHYAESNFFGLFIKAAKRTKTEITMLKQRNADNAYSPGCSKRPKLLLCKKIAGAAAYNCAADSLRLSCK